MTKQPDHIEEVIETVKENEDREYEGHAFYAPPDEPDVPRLPPADPDLIDTVLASHETPAYRQPVIRADGYVDVIDVLEDRLLDNAVPAYWFDGAGQIKPEYEEAARSRGRLSGQ